MTSFRFIHAADLHLDTPFTGVGKVNAALQQKLQDASLAAFDNLIGAAVRHGVDFVLLAGDIYDGAERGVRAQARFVEGLRQLNRNGIQCFFIHGNHDPVSEGWSALRPEDLPASAVLFDQSDAVRVVPAVRDGEILAVVHGISFRSRTEARNLSLLFPENRCDGQFHIGLLHCNVGGQAGHDNYAPCTLEDLCSRAIDYWALGHIHERMVLRSADPLVLYPGNLQARRFDECGPKGATLVHVNDRSRVEMEMLPLDEVRFAQLNIDVSGCKSLDAVLAACATSIAQALAQVRPRLLVTRLRLRGQTAAHHDLLKADVQGQLVPALRDQLPEDAVWLDQAIVATVPFVDRVEVGRSGGFEAALVQLTDALNASDNDSLDLQKKVRAPLLSGTRFDDFLSDLQPIAAREAVAQAESRLLGLMEEGEE
jgi:exonuclease SbcD